MKAKKSKSVNRKCSKRGNTPGDIGEEWSYANVRRVRVAIFLSKMKETDQLGFEPIVKLIRDKAKV